MKKYNISRFPSIRYYSVNAYSRYFIPEIKPNINKALYLDCDLIVQSDIKELFNQDLEGFPLGVVIEDYYGYSRDYLLQNCEEFHSIKEYFNSGVLLMDLEYFRKNNITSKLVNYTIKYKNILNTADQDILNIIFDGNFKQLDYKFNFMPDFYYYFSKYNPELANKAYKNRAITHFTNGKPWLNESIESKLFWEYYRLSPFASA